MKDTVEALIPYSGKCCLQSLCALLLVTNPPRFKIALVKSLMVIESSIISFTALHENPTVCFISSFLVVVVSAKLNLERQCASSLCWC